MPRMTGARFLAETLRDYGVTHVFFVPAIIRRALMEMEDVGIKRIISHGEKSAAYMADAYARVTGKPGTLFRPVGWRGQPGRRSAGRIPRRVSRHCYYRPPSSDAPASQLLSGNRTLPSICLGHQIQRRSRNRRTAPPSAPSGFPRGHQRPRPCPSISISPESPAMSLPTAKPTWT